MSRETDRNDLRDMINSCIGYRILDDDDVLQRGDETVCGSTFLAGHEEFHVMSDDDFHTLFGLTVAQANDRKFNDEMDAEERMFRRKLAP